MMVDQLTVFLENEQGRLAALARALGEAAISMRALTVADTAKFGVVRIIADQPAEACQALEAQGFRAALTKVFAVEVEHVAGGLAPLLEAFDAAGINVEYAYCFLSEGGRAVDVFRTDKADEAESVISAAGFRSLAPEELYA
ncbi:MAG: amino acid-binding protein [Coriobacteriia bacterium]|nr:amino acid-binding protein [Coriobacteriia bacterium]